MTSATTFPLQQYLPLLCRVGAGLALGAAGVAHAGPGPWRGQDSPAVELQRWYESARADCGGPDRPAYQCSGLLLRATTTTSGARPWDTSERQRAKGSVSFSWIRQDSGFASPFVRRNGYILIPNQAVPPGKRTDMRIRCSFPLNASTQDREALHGCGELPGHEATTSTCQTLGVTTAAQWLARYDDGGDGSRSCGWYLEGADSAGAAAAFKAAADAHQGLSPKRWVYNNEVLVAAWPKDSGATLPLHSFFYLEGDRRALVRAQHDQIGYHQDHAQLIPVVGLRFPEDKQARMSFTYRPQDQAIGQPVRGAQVDFEDLAPGAWRTVESDGVVFQLGDTRTEVSEHPHPESGGRIVARHLSVDADIRFTVLGAGRRRVTFAWGCNRACSVGQAIAGTEVPLLENETGQMQYGTHEVVIDGPEAFLLVTDGDPAATQLLLDTLQITPVPDTASAE